MPGVHQLAEGFDFDVITAFKPGFDGLAMAFIRLPGIVRLGGEMAAFFRYATAAFQPIGLDTIVNERIQELLAFGGFNIAFVVECKLKAELLELSDAILLAQSFLHGGSDFTGKAALCQYVIAARSHAGLLSAVIRFPAFLPLRCGGLSDALDGDIGKGDGASCQDPAPFPLQRNKHSPLHRRGRLALRGLAPWPPRNLREQERIVIAHALSRNVGLKISGEPLFILLAGDMAGLRKIKFFEWNRFFSFTG